MSVISTGASGGLYAKALTDVLGIGATINAAGQFVASTGPEIRRVTASPNGTISDFGGSLALDVTNGVVYVNTATGNVAGTVWRVVALSSGSSANALTRVFSNTVSSAILTGNGGLQYFDVTATIPANTLVSGSTVRITGSVLKGTAAGATTITIELGAQTFSGILAVNAVNGTRCYFDVQIISRAAPGAVVSCAGSGSVLWPSLAVSAGGAIANLATNAALVARVGFNAANTETATLETLTVSIA